MIFFEAEISFYIVIKKIHVKGNLVWVIGECIGGHRSEYELATIGGATLDCVIWLFVDTH